MKKTIIVILIFIFIIIGVLYSVRNITAKRLIETNIKKLGISAKIEKVNINIFKTTIEADNMVIYNPKGFKENVLAEIPYIFINFKLISFFKGNIYYPEIRFNLSNLYIEKTAEGNVNLNRINIQNDKSKEYKIGKLVLTMGHIKAVDYSSGALPKVIETDMNIKDEVFTNVTDLGEIAEIIMNKIISNNLFLGLGIVTEEVANMGIKGAQMVGKGASAVGKGAVVAGKGAVEVGKGTAEVFKAIFPFGKGEKKEEAPEPRDPTEDL